MHTPATSLLDQLDFYRWGRGNGGLPFREAWPQAVEQVCKSLPNGGWWRATFAEQRETWRRCYENAEQTPAERALEVLWQERGGDPIPDGEGCEYCGEAIRPERARFHAKFCTEVCRKAAERQRTAA